MNQNITDAAYMTLQIMGIAPQGAEYNSDRNLWYFNATEGEFSTMLVALRSDRAREIGAQIVASR